MNPRRAVGHALLAALASACSAQHTLAHAPRPTSAATPGASAQLVASENRTCLRREGDVLCWGEDPDEPLADDVTLVRSEGAFALRRYPLAGAAELSVDRNHLCARTSDGHVRCYVSRALSRMIERVAPGTPSPESALRDVVHLASSELHACALRADGAVLCWGVLPHEVGTADLGASSGLNLYAGVRAAPTAMPSLSPAVALAASSAGTCAVLRGGHLACEWAAHRGAAPAPWRAPLRATALAMGAAQAGGRVCALRDDGGVQCFASERDASLSFEVPGLRDAVSIAGFGGTFCARRRGGQLACWSVEDRGLVGLEPDLAQGRNAQDVAVGRAHLCTRDARGVACWGDGMQGQRDDAERPVELRELRGATALFGGPHGVCAQLEGHARCLFGERGDPGRAADYVGLRLAQLGPSGENEPNLVDDAGVLRRWDMDSSNDAQRRAAALDAGSWFSACPSGDSRSYRAGPPRATPGPLAEFATFYLARTRDGGWWSRMSERFTEVPVWRGVAHAMLADDGPGSTAWGCLVLSDGGLRCAAPPPGFPRPPVEQWLHPQSAAPALLQEVTAVSHTLALTRAGALRAIRYTPSATQAFSATELAGLGAPVTSFDGGAERGCALTRAGAVQCWQPSWAAGSTTPTVRTIEGLEHPTQVAVAPPFACALQADHRVLCWGALERLRCDASPRRLAL